MTDTATCSTTCWAAAARTVSFAALAEPHFADARQAVAALGIDCAVIIEDAVGVPPPSVAAALRVTLQHVAPNMVDRSIAPAVAAGRLAQATLWARARAQGDDLVSVFEDDGAGFDAAKIAARAVAKGLSQDPSDPFALIAEPGFTTLDHATLRSGRGVGLAAAAEAAAEIGGRLRFENRPEGGGRTVLIAPSAGLTAPSARPTAQSA